MSGKMKSRKTISKRVRVTKSGKLIKRKNGQDHFNGRESGDTTRGKRSDMEISKVYTRTVKSMIGF